MFFETIERDGRTMKRFELLKEGNGIYGKICKDVAATGIAATGIAGILQGIGAIS